MSYENNERLSEQIKDVLLKVCPAFVWEGSTTAIWHGCNCKALQGSCTCVWHCTSKCKAGYWPQLDFVDKDQTKERAVADIYLEKAKAAIAAASD